MSHPSKPVISRHVTYKSFYNGMISLLFLFYRAQPMLPHDPTKAFPSKTSAKLTAPIALTPIALELASMASSSSSSSSSAPAAPSETLAVNSPDAGTLIPGLPDDVAALILASLPYPHQLRLRSTCRSWRSLLSPASLLPLRRRLRLPRRHLLCLFPSDPSLTPPLLFDPAAPAWSPLPPLPCSPHIYGLSNFVPVALGHHLYLLGGSHFDTRSYPLGHPSASAAAYRLDLAAPPPLAWSRLPDMLVPRGSFASAPFPIPRTLNREAEGIIVAGGGSRHPVYPSEGSRMSSVEWYDVASGEWRMWEGLPRYRAGCVGFVVRRDEEEAEEEEFWVMGGYGEYRTVSRVVPADVFYRDAVVLGLKSGKWREVGDMWEEGERTKLGRVVAVDGDDGWAKEIFMLDCNEIFRYDFASNRWLKESSLRRKIPTNESCGFVAMNGELYVLTSAKPSMDISETRRPLKKRLTLEIQVYNPVKKKWRLLITNPPFHHPIDFKTAILCTIQI
ncbi:F-box/kelch-repeat protein OR23 [Ananas comosus]|uniref:F-box/kelch-repeat protein OR23 n=2 Tax=Ananas comosus TaxID=4615 RepID=A0A6P5GGW9_ANACO|nr:F-box/kelch-repeat protein OR23 [Ananas comosus]